MAAVRCGPAAVHYCKARAVRRACRRRWQQCTAAGRGAALRQRTGHDAPHPAWHPGLVLGAARRAPRASIRADHAGGWVGGWVRQACGRRSGGEGVFLAPLPAAPARNLHKRPLSGGACGHRAPVAGHRTFPTYLPASRWCKRAWVPLHSLYLLRTFQVACMSPRTHSNMHK